MRSRTVLVAVVLLAGTGAGAAAVAGVAGEGRPPAPAFPSASAVTDAIRAGLPCSPALVGGKYAGAAYDRCDLDGSPVDVRTDGFGPDGGDALTGPNWQVHAQPADLRRIQAVIGGRIRDTPIRTDFNISLGDPAAADRHGTARDCDRLPGAGPALRTGGDAPVVVVPFAGDRQERDRVARCLRALPGARVQELEPFRTNGKGRAAPLPGQIGGAIPHD